MTRLWTLILLVAPFCAATLHAETVKPEPKEAAEKAEEQPAFKTPEEAWMALLKAMGDEDLAPLQKLLSKDLFETMIKGRTADAARRAREAQMMATAKVEVVYTDDTRTAAHFRIADRDMPIHVRKTPRGWLFDAAAMAVKVNEEKARSGCMLNLRQLGKAIALYQGTAAAQGQGPGALDALYPNFAVDKRLFHCPGIPEAERAKDPEGGVACDYVYFPNSENFPHGITAFCLRSRHAGKGWMVLYASGAVEWIEDAKQMETLVRGGLKRMAVALELPPEGVAIPEADAQAAIRNLGSEAFAKRDDGMKVLAGAGEHVRALLEKCAKDESADLEVRKRCEELIACLDKAQQNRDFLRLIRKDLGLDVPAAEAKK